MLLKDEQLGGCHTLAREERESISLFNPIYRRYAITARGYNPQQFHNATICHFLYWQPPYSLVTL